MKDAAQMSSRSASPADYPSGIVVKGKLIEGPRRSWLTNLKAWSAFFSPTDGKTGGESDIRVAEKREKNKPFLSLSPRGNKVCTCLCPACGLGVIFLRLWSRCLPFWQGRGGWGWKEGTTVWSDNEATSLISIFSFIRATCLCLFVRQMFWKAHKVKKINK